MKRFTAIALAALMVLTVFASVIPTSAVTVSTVEIRSPVFNGTDLEAMATAAGGSLSTNYTDFAGFYYELDDGVGSEAITISNGTANVSLTNTIEDGGLVYTTDVQNVSYEFDDWNKLPFTADEQVYEKLGFLAEEYVPIKSKPDKLSKLIMDSDKKFTLRTGQSLDLGDGYAITAQQVDVEGDKVWLELTKDGEFVDDEVITVSGTGTITAKDRTWEYDDDIAGETDVVLMRVHVKEVFQGQVDSLAVIKGIWLISDDIKTIESDDKFGKLEITNTGMGANGVGLTLKNENSITLTSDTVIDLSDGMKIKVADSTDDVRFYFMKEITEPGTHEVRGTVVNASATLGTPSIWNETSFAGFYYDIDDNVASESLNITVTDARTIAKEALIYTTTIQNVSYEYDPWSALGETYDKIGLFAAEYVPIKGKAEKLSKLITDSDKKFTIRTGQSLDIGGGFALVAQQVDVEGDKVWLELTKDGEYVADEVVDVTGAAENSSWNYKVDVGGETDVVLMRVHVKEVFQGQVDSLAVIKGIWLISDDIREIKSDDEFGKLDKITLGGNYLEMTNDNSITLSSDTVIELAEDMKLRVADSPDGDVRYYPFVEYTIGDAVEEPEAEPEAEPEVEAEPPEEEPGFEAIFAIAGLLAVAFLVRRNK